MVQFELKSWWITCSGKPNHIDRNIVFADSIAPRNEKGLTFLKKLALKELNKELRKSKSRVGRLNELIDTFK